MITKKPSISSYAIAKKYQKVPLMEIPLKEYYQVREWRRLGLDNLWPQAVAAIGRKSPVHSGILKSKSRYCTGQGFSYDEKNKPLDELVKLANANGETLRDVTKKLTFDKLLSGNAWMEVVTNQGRTFLNLYHKDTTKCRLSFDGKEAMIHPDWSRVWSSQDKIVRIPLFPEFGEPDEKGNIRSMIHFKSYEPDFDFYGVSPWIAAMKVVAILYKSDKWNLSRVDNSFQSSGLLLVDGEFKDENEADQMKEEFLDDFTGEDNQGKILFIAKSLGGGTTTYTPFNDNKDADWLGMDKNSTEKLVVAHEWFRALTSLNDNTGFDTKRILNEYEVAVNTVIPEVQSEILTPIKRVLNIVQGIDTTDLGVINKPPIAQKPSYIYVWEARKADGLDYDEKDDKQKLFLAELNSSKKKEESNG